MHANRIVFQELNPGIVSNQLTSEWKTTRKVSEISNCSSENARGCQGWYCFCALEQEQLHPLSSLLPTGEQHNVTYGMLKPYKDYSFNFLL